MVTTIAQTNGFKPSQYQIDIYNFVKQSLANAEQRRNLVISAKAGTGKSSTVAGKHMMEVIPSHMSILYLTFMREVNLDLNNKVTHSTEVLAGRAPQASVRTCHSIGNGCLKDINITGDPKKNGRKYNHLCQQYLKEHMAEYDYKLSEHLAELVNKVRLTLADTDEASLKAIIRRYSDIDIDTTDEEIWPIIRQAVPFILQTGIKKAKQEGIFDFTDQIWLPSSKALNLQPSKYDIVMIDEAQDLSPCIRELALKTAKKSGMVISVGDPNQAIMAFAGASPRSLAELQEATNAAILPLNKNYRCPKSVIRLAQKLVPEIEAWEDAEEGEVNYITQNSVASMAQIGDMILCRYNAPLVEMAIDLIKMRKRCIVKGRDLGGNVTSFIEKVVKFFHQKSRSFVPEMFYADLVTFVREYRSRMIAVLSQNEEENESKISKLDDDCDTLLALFEGYQEEAEESGSYQGFVTFIENFFKEHGETKEEIKAESRKYTITLSTGHKAKGLENPNVFILGYDELPSSKAKTQEAIEQENNLLYVMITRPQKKLYCVVKEPEMYQAEKDFTMGIVPQELPEVEEEISPLVATYLEMGREYEEAVNAEYDNQPVVVESTLVDAPISQPVPNLSVSEEKTSDYTSKPEKRTYGGRKALPKEDKRVFFQQTWDVSIREAFSTFTDAENSINNTNLSEADMLEAVLLGKANFAEFFSGSVYEEEYQARLARAEERRQAYKGKRTKKVVEPENPDPDDDGGGIPTASNLETVEETPNVSWHVYGCKDCGKPVERAIEGELICPDCWGRRQDPEGYEQALQIMAMQAEMEKEEKQDATTLFPAAISEGKVKRVAYSCLSKKCKHSWLTDYMEDINGQLFRMDGDTKVYQYEDFGECPYCKNKRQYIKVSYPKMRHSGTRKCDSRCWNARPGSPCSCACGGSNHSTGHANTSIIGQPLLQLIEKK